MPEGIEARFTAEASEMLRKAVEDADGQEVFLLGRLDEQKRVQEVRVLARGNRHAVPALLQIPRVGEVVIHNHPSGRLVPSDADLSVSSALGNRGVGSYLVNNAVTEVYVIVEPHLVAAPTPLVAADTVALLDPDGAVALRLAGYEDRPGQRRMMEAVGAAFSEDSVLTVEAGTGTGKSLAYLIPAVAWSLRNSERVILSTHTIHLQEQLIRKDLPFLVEQVGLPVTAALVKGRSNYLCQRKASQVEAQPALVEEDISRELGQLLEWARTTKDGSLADLPARPRPEVWEQVVSENDNCLRARCPYYSTCFFYTSRRNAAKADLVIVNHHLLMADLALRHELGEAAQNAILPPAPRVILDEAHHLPDVATDYFGNRIAMGSLERIFRRLQSQRVENRGVLPALRPLLAAIEGESKVVAEGALRRLDERLLPRRRSLGIDAEQTFLLLLERFEEQVGRSLGTSFGERYRVVPALRESPWWRFLESEAVRLADGLAGFAHELDGLLERLEGLEEEGGRNLLYLATELRALKGRLASFAEGLGGFVAETETDCLWVEVRDNPRTGKSLALCRAPIEVGPLLEEALFGEFSTVVMTSATLAVERRFDHFAQAVGVDRLPSARRRSLVVESPFDFPRQALLALPNDLPEPTDPAWERLLPGLVEEIVRAADGGTFVLFTAYGTLTPVVNALEGPLTAAGFSVLRQGQANRQYLLEEFRRRPRAVLFATDSFWEGVDVPGDALRCVILTRLPFRVPTEPIEQARTESIEERGGNPFFERTVPQAVIKLKQGFGRLIRSRRDHGAVVVLDSRIVRKRYGRTFLDSLPPARRLIAGRSEVVSHLREFFRDRPREEAAATASFSPGSTV